MSDFPSIDELSGAQGQTSPAGQPLQVASQEIAEKFEKKMGQISLKEKEQEAMKRAAQFGFPHIDLEKFPIGHDALRQVPKQRAEQLKAVCFFVSQEEVRVGAVDPSHPDAQALLKEIETRNHARGGLYTISENSLKRVLDLYATMPTVEAVTKDISISAEDLEKVQADVQDFKSLQDLIAQASTTDVLTYVLGASLKLDASDVHVEPEEGKILVRFRLDGILHDVAELSADAYRKVVSRVKLMSSLKINVTETPQDGRFTIKPPQGDVDVRVSTMPTVHGEGIVMRLLYQAREGLTLESLGLREEAYNILKQEIMRPNGMVITTGPTGSGKTTTLYSVLQLLNKTDVKIITLEDPVEYRIEGINQSQIDRTKDYTFAKGLKSILRQDPDIAMVGEIRDFETAEIAVQAALTGHLMLSTLHTNSAVGAIPRFISMGVKPFLLAPALNCLIGQRLVRKLNDTVKVPATLTPEQEQRVTDIIASMPEQIRAKVEQMPRNFFTAPAEFTDAGEKGYTGRIGIYEVLAVDDEMEELILSGSVSEQAIAQIAHKKGMLTMVQDGVIKALEGITSIDEVFRVIE